MVIILQSCLANFAVRRILAHKIVCVFYNVYTEFNERYIITYVGIDEVNDPKLPIKKAQKDIQRIDYHRRHLYYVAKAIK